MAQATEYKEIGLIDPVMGIHSLTQPSFEFGSGWLSQKEVYSLENRYLETNLLLGFSKCTYAGSFKVKSGLPTSETFTTFVNGINDHTCDRFLDPCFEDKYDFQADEQVSQPFLESSTSIIIAANSLLKSSKPLEGEPLDVLNKTFKRLFKKTPTIL